VSLLLGWWAYCLSVGTHMESNPELILIFEGVREFDEIYAQKY
jgi:hypothetical protein